jgi:hypothetical protein
MMDTFHFFICGTVEERAGSNTFQAEPRFATSLFQRCDLNFCLPSRLDTGA